MDIMKFYIDRILTFSDISDFNTQKTQAYSRSNKD